MLFQLRRSNIPKGDDRGKRCFQKANALFTFGAPVVCTHSRPDYV